MAKTKHPSTAPGVSALSNNKPPFWALIVGDWVVDDLWLVSQESQLAGLNVGQYHFASINTPTDSVREAGGAGRVASFIRGWEIDSKNPEKKRVGIIGMGVWHDSDTRAMFELCFNQSRQRGLTPHRVTKPASLRIPDDAGVRLYNLGKYVLRRSSLFEPAGRSAQQDGEEKHQSCESYGTSRVFRVYQRSGGEIIHAGRIDWQRTPDQPSGSDWFSNKETKQHLNDLIASINAAERRPIAITQKPNDDLSSEQYDEDDYEDGKPFREDVTANENIFSNVKLVVVKDMGKGVITNAIIEALLRDETLRNAKWFISTRRWEPDWLQTLIDANVCIRLIIFQDDAIHSCSSRVPSWITPRGKDGRQPRIPPDAVKELRDLADKYFHQSDDPSKSNRIVICCLLNKLNAVAIDAQRSSGDSAIKYNLCWQPDLAPGGDKHDLGLGLASAYFSAITLGMIQDELIHHVEGDEEYSMQKLRKNAPMPLQRLIDCATRVTEKWISRQHDELIASETNEQHLSREEFRMCVTYSAIASGAPITQIAETLRIGTLTFLVRDNSRIPFRDAMHYIKVYQDSNAVQDLDRIIKSERDHSGLIPWRQPQPALSSTFNDKQLRIEMWRGMLDIDKYVCRRPSKRRAIAALRERIARFIPREASQPLAAVLIASPGTGKTNFIRQLALQHKIHFLPFNITTLIRREAILSCFDQIATTQAGHHGEPLLVFFDEINAHVEGQHVYDLFLTPLDEGYYLRDGLRFSIRPCIWFFAGTRSPGTGKEPNTRMEDNSKASDFMSRMTLDDISLDGDASQKSKESPEHRLEMVYLGLALARSIHHDISQVTRHVIRLLASIKPGVPARSLRTFLINNLQIDSSCGRWRANIDSDHIERIFGEEGRHIYDTYEPDDNTIVMIDYS